MGSTASSDGDEVAERVEERLAVPVVTAALVSVPAVFLTMTGGPAAVVGMVLNWASVLVLAGESVLLLWLSRDRFSWIREHKWKLLIVLAAIPAVVLLIGPVQILRLVLAVGAVRVLRVRRIMRAGAVLRRRAELGNTRMRWVYAALTLLAASFVGLVLADPTSTSRRFSEWVIERVGVLPAVVGGVLLAAGTLVAVRYRARNAARPGEEA